jgi:hypothetical protein
LTAGPSTAPRRHLPGQYCRRHLAGTTGALFLPGAGRQRLPHPKSHPRQVIFSEQDVIKDPPFSKLDLISCRNLLIYMGGGLQKKLMPLFHYALNPGGMLFLGTSETVGEFVDLFATLDRKSKLYQRKEEVRRRTPHGASPPAAGRWTRRTALREGARRKQGPGARVDRAGAAATVRPARRADQRTRRHPLPARPHRQVPGTGPGRGRHEHPEDGPRRFAAGLDHRPAQSGGAQSASAPPGPADQNQRRFHDRQSDGPAGARGPGRRRLGQTVPGRFRGCPGAQPATL